MGRYIGIDPSTKTGFVILGEDGQVQQQKEISSKKKQDPERFIDLAQQVLDSVTPADFVCIEGFSYGSKGAGVSTQYGIGWMIRAELYKRGIHYIEVPPSSLKKFATGKGNCKKDAMVLPIFKKWQFESDSDNIRDAYVLAKVAEALQGREELTAYQKEALKKVGK